MQVNVSNDFIKRIDLIIENQRLKDTYKRQEATNQPTNPKINQIALMFLKVQRIKDSLIKQGNQTKHQPKAIIHDKKRSQGRRNTGVHQRNHTFFQSHGSTWLSRQNEH